MRSYSGTETAIPVEYLWVASPQPTRELTKMQKWVWPRPATCASDLQYPCDNVIYNKKYTFGLCLCSWHIVSKTLVISKVIKTMGDSLLQYLVFCPQIAPIPETTQVIKGTALLFTSPFQVYVNEDGAGWQGEPTLWFEDWNFRTLPAPLPHHPWRRDRG